MEQGGDEFSFVINCASRLVGGFGLLSVRSCLLGNGIACVDSLIEPTLKEIECWRGRIVRELGRCEV
jgi:hypothetical protein